MSFVHCLIFVSEPPSKKRKWSLPHLSLSPSAYAKQPASSTNNPVRQAPLYSHWLAMEMYKEFHRLSASCTTEIEFKFELPIPSSLESVVESFMLLPKFSSCCVRAGRGVLCNDELKGLEIEACSCTTDSLY